MILLLVCTWCLWTRPRASERKTGGCGWKTTIFPCVLTSQRHGGRGDTHHCWTHPGQLVFRAPGHRRFDDLRHAGPPPEVCRGFAPFSSPPLPRSGIPLVLDSRVLDVTS